MTSPIYTASVPVFKQMLGGLSQVLIKAEAHATAKNIEEVPKSEDNEQSFADLQARIATVLAFIEGLAPEKFDDAATREIVSQAGKPREKRFSGESYIFNYGLPQFFFHTTTAYAILRHNGVEVGKKDYIGSY